MTRSDKEQILPMHGLPHLTDHYASQIEGTVELVVKAIEKLQESGALVSLASLQAATYEVSGGKRKISHTTILRNEAAYALYKSAATGVRIVRRRRVKIAAVDLSDEQRKKEVAVIHRLKRKSKEELITELRDSVRQNEILKRELSKLRGERLDAIVPASVKTLRT